MGDIAEFVFNKLERLDEKLDEHRDQHHKDMSVIGDRLQQQCRLLEDYNKSLREHMKRTDLLENIVVPLQEEFAEKQLTEKISNKKWKKIMVIAGVVATMIGILTGIASLLDML